MSFLFRMCLSLYRPPTANFQEGSEVTRCAFPYGAVLLLSLASSCASPAKTPPGQPAAAALEQAANSLCDTRQTTYFSCQTPQHKTISLCGALPSALQYRYGKPGKEELAFPDDATSGARQFAYAHYSRYQTERSEITFSHGDADYTVFDHTEDGRRSAGVQVATAGGKAVEIQCAGPIHGTLAPLGKSLHCDRDNALNGGQCP